MQQFGDSFAAGRCLSREWLVLTAHLTSFGATCFTCPPCVRGGVRAYAAVRAQGLTPSGAARFRGLAQLVEHRSPKPRVVGSSPSAPARRGTIIGTGRLHWRGRSTECKTGTIGAGAFGLPAPLKKPWHKHPPRPHRLQSLRSRSLASSSTLRTCVRKSVRFLGRRAMRLWFRPFSSLSWS